MDSSFASSFASWRILLTAVDKVSRVGGRYEGKERVPELFLLREVADIVEEMLSRRSPRPPLGEHAHPKTQSPAKEKCGQAIIVDYPAHFLIVLQMPRSVSALQNSQLCLAVGQRRTI